MLRYDFDIQAPGRGHRRAGPFLVRFRDRSTAQAFRDAPAPVRAWLEAAGFVDGVSGSMQVPGAFPRADEDARDLVMARLERGIPRLPACHGFDIREFLAQALRARAEATRDQRPVTMASFWSRHSAAS